MDVIVSRSGGLAGLRLTWEVRVEEQPDADEWYLLIREIPWSQARPVPPEPDRYMYRIRCESHEATLAERQLTGPWRTLVDRVKEASEPEHGRPSNGSDRVRTSPPTRPRRDDA
jgi:Emfourin